MTSITREEYLRFIKDGGITQLYFRNEKNRSTFKRFNNDREIVLHVLDAAKSTSGEHGTVLAWGVLKYASEELKNDKEVVAEALKYFPVFFHAGSELKDDPEFVLEVIKKKKSGRSILTHASSQLRNDPKFVCECIRMNQFSAFEIGDQLCESSLFAKMMKGNWGDFETSLEEFEHEEIETKYQRNEIDEYFFEHFFHSLKRGDEQNDNHLRIKGMELCDKLKERNLSLFTNSRIDDGDDGMYLKRMKRELFKSDRDLFEEVKKWKMESRIMNGRGDFFDCRLFENRLWSRHTLQLRERFIQENVCFKNLECFRVLGRGAFGSTYLCRISGVPGLFVIKLYQSLAFSPKEEKKEIERDSIYLDDHDNVVPILFHKKSEEIDISKLPDYEKYWKRIIGGGNPVRNGGMLVMKYHRISLQKWINYRVIKNGGKADCLFPKELGKIIGGIVKGLHHLHKHLIVHRDLHPGNIFVHPHRGRVLIGDFGCALDLRNNPTKFKVDKKHEILYSVSGCNWSFNKTGGQPKYCSPEILKYSPEKDGEYLDYSKSDLYSVGVLAMEMVEFVGKDWFDPTHFSFWETSSEFLSFVDFLLKDFKERIPIGKAVEIIDEFERRMYFFESKGAKKRNKSSARNLRKDQYEEQHYL